MSPTESQAHVEKYMAWSKKLADEGRLEAADGLTDEIRTLKGGADTVVTDGPYTEAKEVIGGFYVFQANSFDEAEAIAKECPGLEYGQTIELREQMDYS